ncbi:hypothetical protein Tco_1559157 [Tanacetum coccineum]
MSSNFRSFLRGLLNKHDPHSRLTGPNLLDHPFVAETFDDVEARELRANTAASRGCDAAWKGEQHVQTTTLTCAPVGEQHVQTNGLAYAPEGKRLHDPQVPLLKAQVKFLRQGC